MVLALPRPQGAPAWVPMVAIIMVAEKFGTGRGTLYESSNSCSAKTTSCRDFGELTGTSAPARFNDRLAIALFALVSEADDEEGHLQTRRRMPYDSLKNAIDPSPTARQSFEEKGHDVYAQRRRLPDHRDSASRPDKAAARRPAFRGHHLRQQDDSGGTADIRAWMAIPENIGALHRACWRRPLCHSKCSTRLACRRRLPDGSR